MAITTNKGFIKDWSGNYILPITRGELVLDANGNAAFQSEQFLAKDGHPGLITAAERAMLSGGVNGEGIADIYTKLGYINAGLSFGGTTVNFYDSNGKATPISVVSTGENKISIVAGDDNAVRLGLAEIQTEATSVTNILKSITVDKYGRVTAVTGAALTDAEIPKTLTEKTLSNGVLTNCTTSSTEIGTDAKAVVNKHYVDSKIQEITGLATGALKFGGPLDNAETAESYLTDKSRWNQYFKVTAEFTLNTSDLYDTAGITGSTIKVKVGDTLVTYVANSGDAVAKYVYVPSGDDITTITVDGDNNAAPAVLNQVGNVTLKFSSLFSVENNPVGTKTAYISIPAATSTQNGYLSKEDYAKFSNYAASLKVEYSGEIAEGSKGSYKIGTLTIGSSSSAIYGRYNVSSLSLTNGTTDVYNPILKFTETGEADVKITVKGVNGIVTKKNDNDLEIAAANEVATDSVNYLEIDSGYKFKVKIGSVEKNAVVNGLTDYNEFAEFRSNVISKTTVFVEIANSLTDTTKTFYYGSTELQKAVAPEGFTI